MAGNREQFTLQFNTDTAQAKKAINDLMNSLKDVTKRNSLSLNINADLIKGAEAAQELEAHLRSAVNVNTGQLNLVAFNKSLQQSGQSLNTLVTNLANAGSTGQQAFLNLATAIAHTQVPLRQTNALINNMMTTLKNTVKWELSSSVVHGLESTLSGAVSYVKELNSSLTDIRIVTEQSIEDMSRFAEQANRAAKELSTTTKAYADASLIYYQQGDNQEQVAKKAAITIKAANASFNTSAAEMSEYLTAVWNSYRVGADELERYVDIMASLGAKTATSLEEIATSMQKVAATANTVGVSMEQVSSIIATVSSVTRESAESIGTAYKTIFARIGDLKLGETLEDGVNLGQVSSQLDKVGVQILNANGEMRDMGSIIEDLGSKWQTMSRAEQTAIAQVVAGKRQYTQLMALFSNWDQYQSNMSIAENSEGSLQEMADIYAESWEAASARVKASLESIYSSLINDQAIIKMTNAIASITNGVGGFVKALGGAKGVITMIGAVLLKAFSTSIVSGVQNLVTSIGNFVKGPAKAYAQTMKDVSRVLATSADANNQGSIQQTVKLISLKEQLLSKERYLTTAQQMTAQAGLSAYENQIQKLNQLEIAYENIGADLDGLAAKLGKMGGAELDNLLKHLTTSSDRFSLLTDESFIPEYNKSGALSTQVAKNWTKASQIEGVALTSLDMISPDVLNNLNIGEQKIAQFTRVLEQLQQATKGTKLETLFDGFDASTLAADTSQVELLKQKITELSTSASQDAKALEQALTNAINNPALGNELTASLKEIRDLLSSGQIDGAEAFTRLQQLMADTDRSAEKLHQTLENLPTKVQKITQAAAQTASALMSAVTAGNAISGAMSTVGDESASTAEKVGSIVSATSMGLMGITSMISAVKSLAAAFGAANVSAGWIALIGIAIAGIVTAISTHLKQAEERIKKFREDQEKALENLKKDTDTETEDNASKQELMHNYQSLYETYIRTGEGQDALRESAYALAEAYGIVGKNVLIATGNFEAFNKEIIESLNFRTQYEKIKQLQKDSFSAMDETDPNSVYSISTKRTNYDPKYYTTDTNLQANLYHARELQITGMYEIGSLAPLFNAGSNGERVYGSNGRTYNLTRAFDEPWSVDNSHYLNFSEIKDYLNNEVFEDEEQLSMEFMRSLYMSLAENPQDIGDLSWTALEEAYKNMGKIRESEWRSRLQAGRGMSVFNTTAGKQFLEIYKTTTMSDIQSFSEDMLYDASQYFSGDTLNWNALTGENKYARYKELQEELTNELQPAMTAVKAKMAEVGKDDPYYRTLKFYLEYLESIETVYTSVIEDPEIKKRMGIIEKQNALLESLRVREAQMSNFFSKNEANTEFANFVTDMGTLQTSIDEAMFADKDAFESLSEYMIADENNSGYYKIDPARVDEYNAARAKIMSQFVDDYTSFDDYLKIYEDIVNRFSDNPLSGKAFSAQDKVFEFIQDAGIKTIDEFTYELMNAIEMLISSGEYDFLNDNLVKDILNANKKETAFNEAKNQSAIISSWADNFSENMSIDEGVAFYKAIEWGENTQAGEWDDFLEMDYEQREAHIQRLAETYEDTVKTEAIALRDLRKDSYEEWKALIDDEQYGNFYGAYGGFTHGNEQTGFNAAAHQQAFLTKMQTDGYAWDANSQKYIAKGKQSLTKEEAWNTYVREAQENGEWNYGNIEYNQVERFLSLLQNTGGAYVEWIDAESVVHALDLIDSAVESNITKISRLVKALTELPTDAKELGKLAEQLGVSVSELVGWNDETRTQKIMEKMSAPTKPGENATDQDWTNYYVEQQLWEQANDTYASIKADKITNDNQAVLANAAKYLDTLNSIDVTKLPERGTKAYERFARALGMTTKQLNDFLNSAKGESAIINKIAQRQNELVNNQIRVNSQLQTHYKTIMDDKNGKYSEEAKLAATQEYYSLVAEGNNLILQQEQNIANARTQAAEIYAQQADMAKARMEEAKLKAEELKTVAEEMTNAIETGELSETAKQTLNQAGYLNAWKSAVTAAERAALAQKAWSEYVAETTEAAQQLQGAYNSTANILQNKGAVAKYTNQKNAYGEGGNLLDLQNREDYLEYLRQYANMTEEQIGHVGEAWDNLTNKGIDLSKMTNGEITETLANELINMGVEMEQAWQMAAASAKDAMSEVGKAMVQDHIEAAQTAVDAWLSAFKQIAAARKKLLSGKTLVEDIAGDPLQILQYARSANMTPQKIAQQIISGDLRADQLQFESADKYIEAQMGMYGLDQSYLKQGFGSKNIIWDTRSLGYKPRYNKETRSMGWTDVGGNFVSQETINTALQDYYSKILQTTGLTETQANQLADEIISGKKDYDLLSSARGDLIQAIEASALAQEMWTKQQEAEIEVQSIELEKQKEKINGKEATQSELTDLQGAIERAQEAQYANKSWDSLSSADQDLLSSFGINFNNIDSAAENCANALLACAEAALTLAKKAANDQGYYENAEGNYEQAMTEAEYVAAYGSTFEGGEEAAKAHYQSLFNAKGAEFTTNAKGDKALFIGNESQTITSTIQNAENAVESFRTSAEAVPENTMQRIAESAGMGRNEFEQFTQAMIDAGKVTAETSEGQYEQARSLARIQKGLKAARDSMQDWEKSLKETQGDAIAHNKVLSEMRSSFEEILDMPVGSLNDLSEAFMTSADTAELLKGAMEGDIDSYNKLQAAIAEQLLIGEGATVSPDVQNAIAIISAEMDKLPVNEPIEFGELATVSPQLYSALNTYLNAVAQAGADVQAAAEALGFDVQPVTLTVPYEVNGPTYAPGDAYTDPATGQTYRTIYSAINSATNTMEITAVKVITNKGTRGGNIGGSASPKKSGGGGGGGKKEKKKLINSTDEKERYHEIREEMARTQEVLDRIASLKERAYGKKYIDLLDQETKKLRENIEEQQRYQDEIQGYLAQDRQAMISIGATFDIEGNINNYDELMESIVREYNNAIEKYNNSAQTDGDKLALEDAEERFEEQKENLEQYEETLKLSNDAQKEYLDLVNQLSESELEKITYKLEIKTELNESDLEILQYYQDLYAESLEKQGDLIRNLSKQAGEYQSNLATLREAMAELDSKFASGVINEAHYVEGMEQLRDMAIDYASELENLKQELAEVYENALDMASEEIQNFTEKMQDSADMMETYISLTQLMGRGTNYRELEKFYDIQYQANLNNLLTQRAYVDSLNEQAAYFEEQIEKGGRLTETQQEQYEALQDALREANSELASTTEAALQAVQSAYENSINAIFKELDASIAGTAGSLANLAEQYAYYQEEQERYISTAKELYEVSKLNRSIEQSLEDATTDASKAKLKALQEEINLISEKNDLSEYDIEMMNLQYQLTLAQIALEEAQASKDTVRLTRDQDGNLAYQYTADAQRVHEAQQQYEDVLQQINDLASNRVSELEQQCLEAEQQYLQSAQEILLDTTLTDEERTKRLEELSQRYSETLLFIQAQYNSASQSLTQNQQTIAEHYGQALVNSVGEASTQMNAVMANMIGNAQEHIDAFNQAIETGSMGAWGDYIKGVTALTNASGLTYDNLIANADDYREVANNANQAAQDLIDTFTNSFEDINDATEYWDAHLATLEGVQTMYENIAQSAQNAVTAISEFGEVSLVGLRDLYPSSSSLIGPDGAALASNIQITPQQRQALQTSLQSQLQGFYAAQLGILNSSGFSVGNSGFGNFEQHVEIVADFPNATNQDEIRMAFEELINLASQHAYSSSAVQNS